jgi:phage shock protein PspC (stress-responsive transcriptional regulator)
MKKRLYRSEKNKIIAGVCGGIGEYFDIDPTLIRLIWIIITVFTAVIPGIVIYLIAMLIMPVKR